MFIEPTSVCERGSLFYPDMSFPSILYVLRPILLRPEAQDV